MRALAILLSIVLVSGCLPESDHPLTDPDTEKLDSSLYGTWYWMQDDEWGYLHLGVHQDTELLQVIWVAFDTHGELEVMEFSGHTSQLGDSDYINLKSLRPEDAFNGYLLISYRIDGDSLSISLLDNDEAEEVIRHGWLTGIVKEGKSFNSVHITADQKELRQFIVDHHSRLFKSETHFHRLSVVINGFPPVAGSER